MSAKIKLFYASIDELEAVCRLLKPIIHNVKIVGADQGRKRAYIELKRCVSCKNVVESE